MEDIGQLQTWLDAVESVPSQVQSFISVFRMVQHRYDSIIAEIKSISDQNDAGNGQREQLTQLLIQLQDVADKKLELTSAIKHIFGM